MKQSMPETMTEPEQSIIQYNIKLNRLSRAGGICLVLALVGIVTLFILLIN